METNVVYLNSKTTIQCLYRCCVYDVVVPQNDYDEPIKEQHIRHKKRIDQSIVDRLYVKHKSIYECDGVSTAAILFRLCLYNMDESKRFETAKPRKKRNKQHKCQSKGVFT